MCGIVGYLGKKEAQPIIIEGLKRLEYRGYDSAGIAVFNQGKIEIKRSEGKLKFLETLLEKDNFNGGTGIGHTRWATHGRPSETNAHPYRAGGVVVVHNGIIENYLELKAALKKEGHKFTSETDTEIISHLINKFILGGEDFVSAVQKALKKLKGSYAVGVIHEKDPDKLIAARKESPLVIGWGDNEYFLASDIPAILPYTREMVFLEDGEMAIFSYKGPKLVTLDGKTVKREPKHIHWDPLMAEKGGYKHFMLKEIFEQPRALVDTFRDRILESQGEIVLDDFTLSPADLNKLERIYLVACGTSWHAALTGKFMLEKLCRIPVEVDLGSEFRYRDSVINENCLLITISQSGETADTMAALREGKKKKALTLSICNVLESSIARESGAVLYTRAGPEIGVASTKAFTTQLAALYLLAIYLGRVNKRLSRKDGKKYIKDLTILSHQVEQVLERQEKIKNISKAYAHARDFLYLGRGISYPIALEGALKLKEISYIHAEGYPAGEMKHGPIALIDENMPVVVLAAKNSITYEKVLSNVEEVKSRGGKVIAVVSDSDSGIASRVNDVIFVPENNPFLTPILLTIPLQLIAYHIAVIRGTDVDQPRNLAKSVTVE